MQIGLLGLGGIGKYHLKCLLENKDISKVHVYTPTSINSQHQSSKLQFHLTEESLFNEIEGVIIASPTHLHKDHILKAMEKRLPVLCEKPLCCSQEELEFLKKNIKYQDLFSINFKL